MKIDTDVKAMTLAQARQEIMKLRRALRKELAGTGNSRCWITLLQALPEGKDLDPLTLGREQFLKNCERYFERNQPKAKVSGGENEKC